MPGKRAAHLAGKIGAAMQSVSVACVLGSESIGKNFVQMFLANADAVVFHDDAARDRRRFFAGV